MKDILKRYYYLEVDELTEYNEGVIFYLNGDYYYFVKSIFDEKYLNNLYIFCKSNNVKCHELVFNKDNHLISEEFVLMKIVTFIENITINDVNYFATIDCNTYKDKYLRLDKVWEMKIDYLEVQLNEFSDNKLINNSFDYFVGIVENLILFFKKNVRDENFRLCLSHSGLNDLSSVDFYNPLKFSIDYWMKDLASYIRLSKDYEFLGRVLDKINNFSDKVYLFVRLIFPIEYFDEVTKVLVDKKDDKKLVDYVNDVNEYENYIEMIQEILGIHLFSWIKKE